MGDERREGLSRRDRRAPESAVARPLVNEAGIPTIIEPRPLDDEAVEGVSRAEVAEIDAEIAESIARRARRARRRLIAAAVVLVALVATGVWMALGALASWERTVATRTALSAAAEIRAAAVGEEAPRLPTVAEIDGVGGVAAVVPEVSGAAPERVGELGYVVSKDRRSATVTAAARTSCVTVFFAVDTAPEVVEVVERDGTCDLPGTPR